MKRFTSAFIEFILKNWKEILIFVPSIIGLVTGINLSTNETTIIILCVVLAVLVLFGLVVMAVYLRNILMANKSFSNANVIKNSGRYASTLLKYAKIIQRKLEKEKSYDEIKRIRRDEKKILKQITAKNKVKKRVTDERLFKQIAAYEKHHDDKHIKSLLSKIEPTTAYKAVLFISEAFKEFDKILLHAEQYQLRIEFGKYLADFGSTDVDRQKAYIDYQGWTYAMQGKIRESKAAINIGIQLIEKYLKRTDLEDKDRAASMEYLMRAYRHLGSSRDALENYPEQAIIDLNKGLDALGEYKKTFEKTPYESRICPNEAGINYGIACATLNRFKLKFGKDVIAKSFYKDLDDGYKLVTDYLEMCKDFNEQHRYVKFLILQSSYIDLVVQFKNEFATYGYPLLKSLALNTSKALEHMRDALAKSNEVLSENIYTDEAIEQLINQRVKLLNYQMVKMVGEQI